MTVDTAALRALCDAASPEPWRNGADPSHFDAPEVRGETFAYYVRLDDDAAFIAAARAALPACLDEIAQLRAALTEALELIDDQLPGHVLNEHWSRLIELRKLAQP